MVINGNKKLKYGKISKIKIKTFFLQKSEFFKKQKECPQKCYSLSFANGGD